MPPKEKVSKKEVAKKQKQVVEDKTFGLKNKNKSKMVQKFVAEVTAGAKRAGLSKDEFMRKESEAALRTGKKVDRKDREAEMRLLFAPAVSKKETAAAKVAKEAAAKKAEEEPEEEMITSQEAYNDAKREADLAKAEAILGEQTDDDVYSAIEIERAALRQQGGLTPVTFDTFVAWKERKARERQMRDLEATKQMMKQAKEMKGKSGRDLFNQLAALGDSLFLDDDEADDDWMVRDQSDDEEEIFDIQVTGTTFSLNKVKDKKAAAGNAQADGEAAGAVAAVGGAGAAGKLAEQVDASLFLDDDVDLPSDDEDDE
mmetsp:Transcript_79164/g.128276  ORF Transcript_79164/g.128276 Transcript_79164/m.128276 type:complete len:315 (+) Transcript_79164:125-1069(+)|eukprot:CAMPEP_0179429162 /NCGR_PEP_ID=MMETSP0799-20121207/14622_1 /TAXON_ID=46947 /ORGANISM="Geminigera cryophila, Strain CCMP2564" /LENGTH=314 /DNA_ID=CAMNT_0021204957 /DNA_START=116 /DNA_END=1060 /DNA_ORIENTATION=-